MHPFSRAVLEEEMMKGCYGQKRLEMTNVNNIHLLFPATEMTSQANSSQYTIRREIVCKTVKAAMVHKSSKSDTKHVSL